MNEKLKSLFRTLLTTTESQDYRTKEEAAEDSFIKDYIIGFDENTKKYTIKLSDTESQNFTVDEIVETWHEVYKKLNVYQFTYLRTTCRLENTLTKRYRRFFKAGDLVKDLCDEFHVLKNDEEKDGFVFLGFDSDGDASSLFFSQLRLVLPKEEVEKLPLWQEK